MLLVWSTSKSVRALTTEVGGAENMPCLPRGCRNYLNRARRLQLKDGNANAVHKHFSRIGAFHFEIDVDGEGWIQNVFRVDARSRAAYKEFNDVVTFDTSYLLNRYNMPCAPFIAVNHHGHSILSGCALLSGKDVETFEWLFFTWIKVDPYWI